MSADAPVEGVVDYLANAFTPDRRPLWDKAIGGNDLAVKVRPDGDDGFAEPEAMVERMDELGVATLVLPAVDGPADARHDGVHFDDIACTRDEAAALAERWPGRFAALAVVHPDRGMAGVRQVRRHLVEPWVVGTYVHTHSWDRRLDHADYYPYYAVCAELDVPVAMQVGMSGGHLPSECGHPVTIDRAALYFAETRFVLSHIGWPWADEAVALAHKFPNVYVGTASWPPRRWPDGVRDLLAGAGTGKVLFGTNFPTVGHRQALGQVAELGLDADVEAALLGGTARTVFTRLGAGGVP